MRLTEGKRMQRKSVNKVYIILSRNCIVIEQIVQKLNRQVMLNGS